VSSPHTCSSYLCYVVTQGGVTVTVTLWQAVVKGLALKTRELLTKLQVRHVAMW
jgi:hypothetical protein